MCNMAFSAEGRRQCGRLREVRQAPAVDVLLVRGRAGGGRAVAAGVRRARAGRDGRRGCCWGDGAGGRRLVLLLLLRLLDDGYLERSPVVDGLAVQKQGVSVTYMQGPAYTRQCRCKQTYSKHMGANVARNVQQQVHLSGSHCCKVLQRKR